MTDHMLSSTDLAEMLGVSRRTIDRLRESGRLPQHVLIGAQIRWPRERVSEWIEDGCPTNKTDQVEAAS